MPEPWHRLPSVMDTISTFSAVVPAEDAKAVLNLSCLSWSKLAWHTQKEHCRLQQKQALFAHASHVSHTLVYGKATTNWTKLSVFTTGGGGSVVVDGGGGGVDGGRVVVLGGEGGGVVMTCRQPTV